MNANDQEILKRVRELVQTERRITVEILWHLREVERRRIFAQLGYSTLFEFCLKELQYTEGSASRRIRAMRLLKDVNELEDSLQNGAISLTTASQLQSFIQNEKKQNRIYSLEEKRNLVRQLQGKSKQETEGFLNQLVSGHSSPPERTRLLDLDRIELRFEIERSTYVKIERIKALLASSYSDSSYRSIIDRMAEITLDRIDPERGQSQAPIQVNVAPIPIGLHRENVLRKNFRDPQVPG